MTEVRDRIVEAAARLLQAEGAAAVTTRGVAQAAGVQAPTIYRLFGDKDGLVEAVAEHVMATYVTAKRATVAQADPSDPVTDLREGWRLHVDFGLANPDLHALMSRSSPATVAGTEVLRTRVRRLAAAGLLRVDEDRAVAMIHAGGTGTVRALLEAPRAERDLALVDAMYDAVAAAILTTAAPPRDDPRTTALAATTALLDDLPGLSDAERGLMGEWLARSVAALRAGA